MAITRDTATEAFQGYGPTLTVAHTVAGTDRFLRFTIGGNATAAAWNGTSMTKIVEYVSGSGRKISEWGLIAPATGSFNAVATLVGSGAAAVGSVTNYEGVAQTSPTSDPVGNRNEFQSSPITTGSFTIPSGGIGCGSAFNSGPDLTASSPASQMDLADLGGTAALAVADTTSGTNIAFTWTGGAQKDTAWASFALAPASVSATATTLSGPSGGINGVASTNFTVGANGTITGTVTVTPDDNSGGGSFSPTSVAISSGTPTATFTYTPASVGAKSIGITDDGGLTDASDVTYTVTSAAASLAPRRTFNFSILNH